MPQFWGGFIDGKLDTREVENGFGGWDKKYRFRAPAIFTSKTEARKQYESVCKVEVRVANQSKKRRSR